MEERYTDLVIIGAGPAGLSAAVQAKEEGIDKVVLIERDAFPGGILNQCIHDGFGLIRFGQQLSGCEYAQRLINQAREAGVELLTDTMVTDVTDDRKVYAVNSELGSICLQAGAVILAMGCRERTRPQVGILGSRPSGVLTAGAVQKYINVQGFKPGKRAVILGSGDIGLIMARRMTLENMEVEGVYEVMPTLGGLRRNKVQCLDDYGIPLHLSTTVVRTHGKRALEGVTVAKVDENRRPIPGTERYIPCDLLVLSVGLIPENELSKRAGVELNPITKGPEVDENMMTNREGIFAAGNVSAVFDLVDYVSETGEKAAIGAAKYLRDQLDQAPSIDVTAGENISFTLPQKVSKADDAVNLYMRVRRPLKKAEITLKAGDQVVKKVRMPVANPPEMIHMNVDWKKEYDGPVVIDAREVRA